VENAQRFIFVGWPVGVRHAHAAEAEGGDLEGTEATGLHRWHIEAD
jgi:hypothetical protein